MFSADEEMEKINDMINVVDYLRQDLEPADKKRSKGAKKKGALGAANNANTAAASTQSMYTIIEPDSPGVICLNLTS